MLETQLLQTLLKNLENTTFKMYYVEYASHYGEDELGNPLCLINEDLISEESLIKLIKEKIDIYRIKYIDLEAQF